MPLIFEHLEDWRRKTGCVSEADACELHGLVCGLLAGAPGQSTTQLIRHLQKLGEWDWTDAIREQLGHGILEAAGQLDSESFAFNPLLPPDEAALVTRATCLAWWAGGFIAGYGASGSTPAPGECAEALQDLAQIARAEVGRDEGDSNDQESAYTQLVEYVRMAAMLVRQTSREQQSAQEQ